MFRAASALVVLCVFLWVLPLGEFIKPSQEKIACGGHRAFHMCCMGEGKIDTNPPSKVSFTHSNGFGHGAKSSASGGDDVILEKSEKDIFLKENFRADFNLVLPNLLVPRLIFHPPQNKTLL